MTQPPGQDAAEAMARALQEKASEMDGSADSHDADAEQPGIHHAEREQPPREQGSPGQQGQGPPPDGLGGDGPPNRLP